MFWARALAYETDFGLLLITCFNVLHFYAADFEITWLWQAADEGVLIHLYTSIVYLTFIYEIHGSHDASEIGGEKGVRGDAWLYAQNLNHLIAHFNVIGVCDHIVFVWAEIDISILHCV